MNAKKLSLAWGAVFILAVLFFQIALAAGSIVLNQFQVDFIEVVKTGNDSYWTYAVTADGDEAQAMDFWTLTVSKVCGYVILDPLASAAGTRTYTTPTSYVTQGGVDICGPSGSYNCQAANYSVDHVVDIPTGRVDLKFFNADTPLASGNPVTHVFRTQIRNTTETRFGDTSASLRDAAGGLEVGDLTGPVCAPTAINLLSLSASSHPERSLLPFLALALLGLIALGWMLQRRSRAL